MTSAPGGPGDPRPAPRSFFWGLVVSITAAAVVALIEIDNQSARVITDTGRAWSIGTLMGIGPSQQGWTEVVESGLLPADCGIGPCLTSILRAHVLVDTIFMISYTLLLIGLAFVMWRTPRFRWLAIMVTLLLVVADARENSLAVQLIGTSPEQARRAIETLASASAAKWLLTAVVGLALLIRFVVPYRNARPSDPRPRARRVLKALMHHRFSVALVLPVLVLTVLAGSAVLEQLPDVQRQWLDGESVVGGQAVAAVITTAVLALALLGMARLRTDWARDHADAVADHGPTPGHGRPEPAASPEPADEAPVAVWLAPPAVAVVGGLVSLVAYGPGGAGLVLVLAITSLCTLILLLVLLPRSTVSAAVGRRPLIIAALTLAVLAGGIVALWLIQPEPPVYALRLAIFAFVPAVIVIGSLVLRRSWRRSPRPALEKRIDRPPAFDHDEVRTIWFVGVALAVAAVVIGGLGLIRAFTSVVVVGGLPASGIGAADVATATGWLWFAGLAVTMPWVVLGTWRGWQACYPAAPVPDPVTPLGPVVRTLPLAVVYLLFITIGLQPHAVGQLGVAAATVLSLLAFVGLPAATGLLIQDRPTAEIFRALGLRRTPLLSVFALTIILVSVFAGQGSIHRVFPAPRSPAGDRPAISDLTATWATQEDPDPDPARRPCRTTVRIDGLDDQPRTVQPMIMIAAEGGGIRATYWTVKALDTIHHETRGCGARSVLFSGGASGGAVGLTVARFSGNPTSPGTDRALRTVTEMAGPQPLSEGVIGTFVRDPAYGATGVPFGHDGSRAWADRARLIEVGWNRAGTWGTRPFLTGSDDLSPATGPLILNSSSVASRCRAWVSQVALEQPVSLATDPACNTAVGPGPASLDLFAAYGPHPSTSPAPTDGSADAPDPTTVPKAARPLDPDCLTSIDASTAAMLVARFPYVTPGGVTGPCPLPGQPDSSWPRTQLIDGGYLENTGLATVTDLAVSWLDDVRTHNEQALQPGSSTPLIVPFIVFLSNDQGKARSVSEPADLQSELILPAVGKLTAGQALTQPSALLQRARATVEVDAFCPSDPADAAGPTDRPDPAATDPAATDPAAIQRRAVCRQLGTSFPYRVIVVDRAARPEVATPLGWVLSEASMQAMDDAMDVQLVPCATAGQGARVTPPSPACQRGYGTLGDLLHALGSSRP